MKKSCFINEKFRKRKRREDEKEKKRETDFRLPLSRYTQCYDDSLINADKIANGLTSDKPFNLIMKSRINRKNMDSSLSETTTTSLYIRPINSSAVFPVITFN